MNTFLENKWLVSITAGILLGLSFPPVNLSFLSFPAFMLFFYLAEKCDSYKQTAYYSYAGFLVWNLSTTYWLMMASTIAGVSANLANAVLMTIPLCLARYFAKNYTNPFLIAFLQAAAWGSYEFLHHNWDLAWPWLAIGNAWSNHVSLIQYISVTGHLGITFWVVLTSALAIQTVKNRTRILGIATIISLLLLPGLSLVKFAITNPFVQESETVNVTVIQPNHDSYQDYGGMSGSAEVLDSLFSITNRVRSEDTDLIVWPENAIDKAILIPSITTWRVADSAKTWDSNFVIGSGLYTLYDPDTEELFRGFYRDQPYNVFNSALFVDQTGSISRYDKANLVPIVERLPFVEFFNAVDLFDWINWGRHAQYGKGRTPDMLEIPGLKTTGLVCYDSVYPSWIREFVRDGADFITIITNDGWWGNSSGHLQHFSYARLRAIEFDRWVVRSANNGTSGIIRPDGTVEQKTDYWVRTGFNSVIPKRSTQTMYSRFGDWLSYLLMIAAGIGWIYTFITRRASFSESGSRSLR